MFQTSGSHHSTSYCCDIPIILFLRLVLNKLQASFAFQARFLKAFFILTLSSLEGPYDPYIYSKNWFPINEDELIFLFI